MPTASACRTCVERTACDIFGRVAFMIGITGASGWIGRALADATVARGLSTRRLLRQAVGIIQSLDRVVGPIDGTTDWTRSLDETTCVIHCAAHVHQMGPSRAPAAHCAYTQVNTHGTLHLARSAALAGVRRFVFLSSIKALGESTAEGHPFGTDSECQPLDAYGRSKWQAEQGLWQIAQETGMEVVIIRPPLVYGPGVKANFRQLMSWVAKGVPLPFADIHNLRSLVYLGNLVDLITVCIDHPNAPGNTFMVSDGHDLSTPDLIRQIAAAMGRSPRLFGMPEPWLRQAARLAGRLPQFERLTQNLQVDMAHTRSVLGWTPPYTVEQGMRETVRAFLHP